MIKMPLKILLPRIVPRPTSSCPRSLSIAVAEFGHGRANRHNSCPNNEFIYAKGKGDASCSRHNEMACSDKKGKSDDTRKHNQPPAMFPENLLSNTALFSCFDNRRHKPREKYAQHQYTVESGKRAI